MDYPLMPTKYIIPVVDGDERNNIPMRVLANRIIKLKKLKEVKIRAIKTARIQKWNKALWSK
jgi:hypothetical protein